MGVEHDLNDPAKGESFDFGKGWLGIESQGEYYPSPSANPPVPEGCYRVGFTGYKWTPLASRAETLTYVRTHFWFLQYEEHSDGCMHTNTPTKPPRPWVCSPGCPFHEPDNEYANRFADKLWAWLEGRDQSQLDITSDSASDDLHCKGGTDHDKDCETWIANRWGRHFVRTGSRYDES